MKTIFDRSTLEELGAGLRGAAYVPGEEGYDEARKAWNLNAHHHPALVVRLLARRMSSPRCAWHAMKDSVWG